jgi:hypothetical protein
MRGATFSAHVIVLSFPTDQMIVLPAHFRARAVTDM